MTATTDALPDYQGETVTKCAVKFSGAGTGFNGLDVRPIVMDLDDEMYVVMRVRAAESPSHLRDKDDRLVRMQRLHIEEMAPVSDEIATAALREYAQQIEEIKNKLDGQAQLFAEQEAEAREQQDGTAAPADIAADAADRVKAGK
ncbi:MAG TPA: hypothetical protein VGK79_00745 [Gaiellaceae bacterium]